MNGAAEAILEEILRQVIISNAHLAGMLRAGAGGGAGGGGGPAPAIAALGAFGAAVKVASIAITAITGVFSYLSNMIGGTITNITAFGKAAIAGTASLSQLFKVFDQLPIIGKVFGLFGSIVSYQESLLSSYRELTQAGASFTGDLYKMRDMAFNAYMTMDEFGKVVSENSGLFATSIGGVDAGLKVFTATQAKLMDPKGELGSNLLGLGVTASEAADMLGLYMRLQGNMTKVNSRSSDEIAKTTAGLITELDAYAKVTGTSRAALEDTMKSAALDENLKRFLSGLDPDQVVAANAKLAEAMEAGGQGQRDLVAQNLMSQGRITAPITQASKDLVVQTRGAAIVSAGIMADSARNNKVGSAESLRATIAARKELADGAIGFSNSLGPGTLGILGLAGAFKTTAELSALVNKETNRRSLTETALAAEVYKLQVAQYKGHAAALAVAEMRIKMFGAALGSGLIPVLSALQPVITKVSDLLIDKFEKAVKSLTAENGPIKKLITAIDEYFVPIIVKSADWLDKTFDELSNTKPDKFWEKVGDKVKEAFANIIEKVTPILKVMWETVKPVIVDLFKGLFEAMKAALFGNKLTDENKASYAKTDAETSAKLDAGATAVSWAKQFNAGLVSMIPLIGDDLAGRMTTSRIDEAAAAFAAQKASQSTPKPAGRASGSLGMTGNLFENFGKETPVMLHGVESVVTPPQMEQIMGSSLVGEIQTLSKITLQMLQYVKETAEHTRRNVDATKNLSGNLF